MSATKSTAATVAHGAAPPDEGAPGSTRERILDIALDLFIEQGFDKTSLRQIAEQLGFTKAALYYHFASKEDILMALHLRIHEVGKEYLDQLVEGPASPESWWPFFEDFIEMMMANRKLFVLHERNQAAFENLHREQHDAEHADFGQRLQEVLSDPTIAAGDRLRMACAMGAVMGGLILSGNAFADMPSVELVPMLNDIVSGVLGVKAKARPRAKTR